jgi:hypothetical protein
MKKLLLGILKIIGRILVVILWGICRLTEVVSGQLAKWLNNLNK